MNKIKLALCAVSMAAVLALSAFAAENFENDANGAFDVSYTGKAGEYYAVVVLSGIAEDGSAPAITEDTIQYIDQKTAGADGKVTFEDILIKTAGTPSTVYLGGSDLDKAVLLGYVNKTSNYKVSGTVTSASSAAAKVTLTSTTDASKTFTVDTANGAYTVTVPADTYKFVVTKSKHLSYTKNSFVVSENVTKDVTLVGGDTDDSGEINFTDLLAVLNNYNTANAGADIDESGSVNFTDLLAVLNNYGDASVAE